MRKLVLAAALTLAVVSSDAATLAGVKIEDQVSVDHQNLVLNGVVTAQEADVQGLHRHLPSKQSNDAAILAADAPRRMVMHFLMDVDTGKIAGAWTEGLVNTPNASPEVKTAFQTLASWMDDMKEGQRITMTYVPGTGTTVEVGGKSKGTLGGKAVADAILNTWIGPKPGPGADFEKSILGR